jgi:LysM repeat protein
VEEGDTVWQLAQTYNFGVCDLARMNGLADPDFIYPGEKFLIPP